uniref:Uncharacterized protein n=1 Tax=Romanomermis culicivorax TaxID=13658 RepID=A0A915IUX4_ROMCU
MEKLKQKKKNDVLSTQLEERLCQPSEKFVCNTNEDFNIDHGKQSPIYKTLLVLWESRNYIHYLENEDAWPIGSNALMGIKKQVSSHEIFTHRFGMK